MLLGWCFRANFHQRELDRDDEKGYGLRWSGRGDRFELGKATEPFNPRVVGLRLNANYNTVKSALTRLAKKNAAIREVTGCVPPSSNIERESTEKTTFDNQKDAPPRLHCLRSISKLENTKTALSQHPEMIELFSRIDYTVTDRGPHTSNSQQVNRI